MKTHVLFKNPQSARKAELKSYSNDVTVTGHEIEFKLTHYFMLLWKLIHLLATFVNMMPTIFEEETSKCFMSWTHTLEFGNMCDVKRSQYVLYANGQIGQ
jgi:hypothetical protein